MKEYLKAFADSKIPSLLIVGLFIVVGALLIKGEELAWSPSLISGGILLILGVFLGILSYSDHRNKEHTDKIIKYYKDALDSVSKTHSAFETKAQSELTSNNSMGTEGSQYIAQDNGTVTQDS
ncbi:hypothetical protein GF366_01025 [Candidatus Peregrinibacteria bacterium]|nr:hypothetical protein [Candidatus Peregrinibacteria bacterium]